MTPRWITWGTNGHCTIWRIKPCWGYFQSKDGYWGSARGVNGDCIPAPLFDRKRGGPKAIRRIRLEKP